MTGELREVQPPGDDDLRAMLEGRAARVSATDAREVLAATRAEIAGTGAADHGGRTFGVRPVRVEPPGPDRSSRMPWRLAVLGVAAVVTVAVLGSRLGLGPTDVDSGGSPTAAASPTGAGPTAAASPTAGATPAPSPIAVLTPAELQAGMADASLDGRVVLVRGQLVMDPWPCPAPVPADCFGIHLEGLDGVPVDRASSMTANVIAARLASDAPIALRVTGGSVSLLGWVVAGAGGILEPSSFAAGTKDLDPFDLALVTGWLAPAHGDVDCPGSRVIPCGGPWPRLTDTTPFLDGTWTAGVPGIDVSFPSSLALDGERGVMDGTFLIESVVQRGGSYAPYAVAATLDGEARLADQVPQVDATPAPTTAPAVGHTTVEAMGRALRSRDGSLDGKLLVVDGILRLAYGRCLGGCTFVQLEGLDDVFIDLGDLTEAEATAAIERHRTGSPIALLVKDSAVALVGWLVAGSADPVGVDWLLPVVVTLPAGDVAVVDGWVIGPGSTTGCPYAQGTTCPGEGPWLTSTAPMPDGTPLIGTVAIPVDVVSTLQLRDAPDEIAGPFLVRAAAPGSGGGTRFEIGGLFSDVVTVDPVASVMPTASPPQPKVVCQPGTSTWSREDASGSPVPIAITLTCENAVAAAKAAAGPQPSTDLIEFAYGYWCPIGSACALAMPNTGHVIFHRGDSLPDLLVGVKADATGTVTAAVPRPLPSPWTSR